MDSFSFFFQEGEDDFNQVLKCILSPPLPPSPPPATAFAIYSGPQEGSSLPEGSIIARNIHRRVLRFLRRMSAPAGGVIDSSYAGEERGGRGFRHMMRERLRRERIAQGYADLRSMLFCEPKVDKNSIIRSAVTYLTELKRMVEKLQRSNAELEAVATAATARNNVVIKLSSADKSSAIGSLIGVLQCVEVMELKVKSILSRLSGDNLLVEVGVETEIPIAEVERAMECALTEEEKKLFPQESKWSLSCDEVNPHNPAIKNLQSSKSDLVDYEALLL